MRLNSIIMGIVLVSGPVFVSINRDVVIASKVSGAIVTVLISLVLLGLTVILGLVIVTSVVGTRLLLTISIAVVIVAVLGTVVVMLVSLLAKLPRRIVPTVSNLQLLTNIRQVSLVNVEPRRLLNLRSRCRRWCWTGHTGKLILIGNGLRVWLITECLSGV